MLLGEYRHSIDAKNRMFLPSKFRDELGESVFLMKNLDRCISIFSQSSWSVYMSKLEALPTVESRDIRRRLLSSVVETPIDSQGRILIPQNLREYADLEKNVRVIGVGESAEIWNEEAFDRKINEIDTDELTAKLIELGF